MCAERDVVCVVFGDDEPYMSAYIYLSISIARWVVVVHKYTVKVVTVVLECGQEADSGGSGMKLISA